jgi:hypothetical protein
VVEVGVVLGYGEEAAVGGEVGFYCWGLHGWLLS